jgi:hypothetical protein
MPPLITEGLRECQIDAVRALETSLAADRPRLRHRRVSARRVGAYP